MIINLCVDCNLLYYVSKPTKVIIVAIMRKLLHIVFGVVKHNTLFNPRFGLDC